MSMNYTEETRELVTFERNLGLYSAAGAICSHGDVIDFVDGEKQGIIIADTCGKRKDCGDRAGVFLREQIESGWGSSRDVKTEILDLGRRLMITGVGKPYLDRETKLKVIREFSEEERWWDAIEFCYAHIDKETISLAGLRYMIFREDRSVEEIDSFLSPYHVNLVEKEETIKKKIHGKDILLITSDGLEWNMRLPYRGNLENLRKYHEKPREDIGKIIGENSHLQVDKIRDILVSELSDYITGKYFADDVTFALVKRT